MAEKKDPKGRFGTGYFKLDGKKTDWILRNVFNCSDQAVSKMKLIDSGTELSAYYQDGAYYTYPYDLCGNNSIDIVITDVRKVNGLYVIQYEIQNYSVQGDYRGKDVVYAVMEQKKIGKTQYWSLYISSLTDPGDDVVKSIVKKKTEKLP